MRRARSFLLVEVMLGLALLAALGVWLLRVQTGAVRQMSLAEDREALAGRVEELVQSWSFEHISVTVPANGRFDERLAWRRMVVPVVVAQDMIADQVTLVASLAPAGAEPSDIVRLDWLVARKPPGKARP